MPWVTCREVLMTTGWSSAAGARRSALDRAYRYLNRRERTVAEMRAHLLAADLAEPEVEAAIANLTAEGYLDDERYARLFTQDKRQLQQWGEGRIRQALIQRGIGRDLVQDVLAQPPVREDAGDDETELARATALLRHRFPNILADRRERARALGVLLRRGYEYEVAVEAMSEHDQLLPG